MYLKKLEIQGFKSFPNKISLSFNTGITAVVGPNGSGKSNISDAIRWVLGEQKIKSLRGDKMEDIIFVGTSHRSPLSHAKVSMVLDNTDRKLPLDFDEIVVSRQIFRNGESNFSINNASCRLKDIHELFMDTGIGLKGYSIIGQGQIEEIIKSKSEDRRLLFEEATGIVKFKSRKNEAKSKLDRERDNLNRANDILKELEIQVGPLEKAKERAVEYLDLYEKLKILSVNSFFIRSDEIKISLKEEENNLIITKNELDEKIRSLANDEEKLEENKKEIFNTNIEIDNNIQNEKEKSNLLHQFENNIVLLNEQIKNIKENVDREDKNKSSIEKSINEQRKKVEVLNDGIQNDKSKLDGLIKDKFIIEEEIRNKNENVKIREKEFLDLKNLKNNLENSILLMNEKNTELKNQIFTTNESVKELNLRFIEDNVRNEFLSNEYTSFQKKIERHKKSLKEIQIGQAKLKTELDNITSKYDHLKVANENDIKLLKEIEFKKNNLSRLEEEHTNYFNSVRFVLNNDFHGVLGVVSDLVKIPEGYEKAMDIAIGSRMQNIVTKLDTDTKPIIDKLKKEKIGRCTFLPLNRIKGRIQNLDYCMGEDGVLGIASNLVEFDPVFSNIFNYILSNTVITKDFQSALNLTKKYPNKFRVITLHGEEISSVGSISGGEIKNKNNFFINKRELEKSKKKCMELISNLEIRKKDLNIFEKTLQKRQYEYNSFLEKNSSLNEELNSAINESEKLKIQLDFSEKELNISKNNIELFKNNILDYSNQIKNNEIKINETDNKILIIREKIEDFKEKSEDCEDINVNNLISINTEINVLKEVINNKINGLKAIEDRISQLDAEIQVIQDEMKKYILAGENKQERLEFTIVKSKDTKTELESGRQNQITLKDRKDTLETLRESITKMIKDETSLINELTNVKLKLEYKIENLQKEESQLYDEIWENYELTYNRALIYKKDGIDIGQMPRQIKEYKNRIKALGNIDVSSIDKYKEVKERYDFLKIQIEDILESEKDLESIITNLDRLMENQFQENFGLIRKNFKEVFKDIFGGGEADLILIDREDVLSSGINIVARPPGKKLTNLNLMSGGEKALTAIALLFSILKMKPSPFSVLDEIEAALDDANVVRFANYLKKYGGTQFILITHRKGTMEIADTIYGVTMEEQGISKIVSIDFS